MIEANVILDSVSPEGHRLTTFQLRYPRFFHEEVLTHRVFSRNASSSRARPSSKLITEARSVTDRAAPTFWGKNKPGMQATEELDAKSKYRVQGLWNKAAQEAAATAQLMVQYGAHKQIVNRILEPFTHINVVVTATEFMNFFGLRLEDGAMPEMRLLADAMWRAYAESRPLKLNIGEWHLPYVTDLTEGLGRHRRWHDDDEDLGVMRKVSVARCARVSYNSFNTDEPSTVEEDLNLYEDKLMGQQPFHASPAEHQATPDWYDYRRDELGEWMHADQHGNFEGWRQYRKMIPGEAIAPLPEGYAT